MSWDSYVTNLTANTFVEEAAICGFESGAEAIWASTAGYKSITVDEIKRLGGNRSDFPQSGPYIAGVKCRLLRDSIDDDKMFSLNLKTAADASGTAYNVCVGKSVKALVIAKGNKDANGGQLASSVFGVVKYLRDLGY